VRALFYSANATRGYTPPNPARSREYLTMSSKSSTSLSYVVVQTPFARALSPFFCPFQTRSSSPELLAYLEDQCAQHAADHAEERVEHQVGE